METCYRAAVLEAGECALNTCQVRGLRREGQLLGILEVLEEKREDLFAYSPRDSS